MSGFRNKNVRLFALKSYCLASMPNRLLMLIYLDYSMKFWYIYWGVLHYMYNFNEIEHFRLKQKKIYSIFNLLQFLSFALFFIILICVVKNILTPIFLLYVFILPFLITFLDKSKKKILKNAKDKLSLETINLLLSKKYDVIPNQLNSITLNEIQDLGIIYSQILQKEDYWSYCCNYNNTQIMLLNTKLYISFKGQHNTFFKGLIVKIPIKNPSNKFLVGLQKTYNNTFYNRPELIIKSSTGIFHLKNISDNCSRYDKNFSIYALNENNVNIEVLNMILDIKNVFNAPLFNFAIKDNYLYLFLDSSITSLSTNKDCNGLVNLGDLSIPFNDKLLINIINEFESIIKFSNMPVI